MEESTNIIDVIMVIFKVVIVVLIGLLPSLLNYFRKKDKLSRRVVFFTGIGTIALVLLEVIQFNTNETQRKESVNTNTDTNMDVDTIKFDVKGVSSNLNNQLINLVILTDSIQKLNTKLAVVKGDVNSQLKVMEQIYEKNAEFEKTTKAKLALNEMDALKLVKSKTLAIYFRMRDIIEPVKLMNDINIENRNISMTDLKEIVYYEPSKNKVYYESEKFEKSEIENAVNSTKKIFLFYNDIRNDAKVIKEDIEGINQLPSTIYLPKKLQNLLSSILTSQLVVSNTELTVKNMDDFAHGILNFDKSMFAFIQLYNELENNYIDTKHKARFRKLTDNEIADLKIKKRQMLKELEKEKIKNRAYTFYFGGIEYRFNSDHSLLE